MWSGLTGTSCLVLNSSTFDTILDKHHTEIYNFILDENDVYIEEDCRSKNPPLVTQHILSKSHKGNPVHSQWVRHMLMTLELISQIRTGSCNISNPYNCSGSHQLIT